MAIVSEGVQTLELAFPLRRAWKSEHTRIKLRPIKTLRSLALCGWMEERCVAAHLRTLASPSSRRRSQMTRTARRSCEVAFSSLRLSQSSGFQCFSGLKVWFAELYTRAARIRARSSDFAASGDIPRRRHRRQLRAAAGAAAYTNVCTPRQAPQEAFLNVFFQTFVKKDLV